LKLEFLGKKYQYNVKNLIIFSLVVFFSLHTLYFVHSFAVNVPLGDEWDFVPFIESYKNGGNFWEEQHFCKQHNEHKACVPHILILISVSIANYNIIPLLYLGWCGLVCSVVLIYFILKRFDEKLTWLIIPFSIIIFNPIHYGNLLWQLSGNGNFFTIFGYIGCVYFLQRVQKQNLSIVPAILFAIIATFSTLPGILVWFIGILSFYNFRENKKLIIIWLVAASVFLTLFFIDYSGYSFDTDQLNSAQQNNFLDTLFVLYSKGFINNIQSLQPLEYIIGPSVLLLTTFGLVYLKFKKISLKKLLPWIQFSFLGLLLAMAYYIGLISSAGVNSLDSSRYGIMFIIPQITALVILIEIIRINFKPNHNNSKRLISIILICVIFLILFLGLGVSYYVGWWHGFHMYEEHRHVLNCLLEPNSDFLCLEHLYYPHIGEGAEILRELKLGPFGNTVNYNNNSNDPILKSIYNNVVGIPTVIDFPVDINKKSIFEKLNVSIYYNKPLHITFNKIIYYDNLEIQLDNNDIYSISFWKNNNWVDRILINTENSSKDEIFSSQIPFNVKQEGFDKIVIIPVKGDDVFRVEKILLE